MSGWHKIDSNTCTLPQIDSPGVLLSHKDSAQVGENIVESIESAQSSISLINPIIDDERVIETLLRGAARKVRVKIITELRKNRGEGVSIPTRGFGISSEHTNLNAHFDALRQFAPSGIFCRGLRHYAHAKLLLVDDAFAIVSSANLTDNSLGWGAQPALEAGLRIDGAAVSALVDAFHALWQACPFRFYYQGRDTRLEERPIVRFAATDLCRRFSGIVMDWSYPPDYFGVANQFEAVIAAARQEIIVAALSFYELDKVSKLEEAFCAALQRGVRITVLIRPEHFSNPADYPDESTKRLIRLGLSLLGLRVG